MLNYAIACYVPPDFFDNDLTAETIRSIRACGDRPLIVVDHAHGIAPCMSDETGPTTVPRRELWSMASERLAMRHDETYSDEQVRRWRRAGVFKAFAIQWAKDRGLDAVFMCRLADRWTDDAVTALATHLERNSDLSAAYLPTQLCDWLGNMEPKRVACASRVDAPDAYLPSWGVMFRATIDTDVFEDLFAKREAAPVTAPSDTQYVKAALFDHGPAEGIGSYGGQKLLYVFAKGSPWHADPDLHWTRNMDQTRLEKRNRRVKRLRENVNAVAEAKRQDRGRSGANHHGT